KLLSTVRKVTRVPLRTGSHRQYRGRMVDCCAKMPFRQIEIPAIGRKLSNIMAHPASADAAPGEWEFEEYFRHAGNCFHCHGEGGETRTKRATGRWLRSRGLRSESFVCTQICHEGWDENEQRAIDRFTPEGLQQDIAQDLELLETEYLDLVYLDDNP